MANYDVNAISINSDGFSADITLTAMSTGGTFDSGFGTNNDPTNAKITFTVTSQGYTSTGGLSTKDRTIYGVPDINLGAMRQVYPNQLLPDESTDANVVIRVALSENIYNDDTPLTADVSSGWYTQGGNVNNACTDLAITNNSVNDYQKPIVKWLETQMDIKTENYYIELAAFHGHAESGNQVPCVKFTVTDEHSHSLNYTVNSMSKSDRADYNSVICYSQLVDVSTLTSGDVITHKVQVYPFIGDTDSVVDSATTGYSFPTAYLCDLKFKLFKEGEFGHTCVRVDGNDSTGDVYGSRTLAEAGSAFLTIAAAMTALQSYHNTNYSRNHVGGGYIYLGENTWTYNSTNGGTSDCWVTITRITGTTKANVVLSATSTNSRFSHFTKFSDIAITLSNTYFTGSNADFLWADNCTFTVSSTVSLVWSCPYASATYNTGSLTANKGYTAYSTAVTSWSLIRGCNHSTLTASFGYCVVGNYNVIQVERGTGVSSLAPDGGIFAYNTMSSNATTCFALGDNYNIDGYAFVQNVMERYGSQTTQLGKMCADSSVYTSNNIIFFNNTFAGARINAAYNDTTREVTNYHTNYYWKGNIVSNINTKDDTFAEDADCIGGWNFGYKVNCISNLWRASAAAEWVGEFVGVWTKYGAYPTILEPIYVDDNSADGGNTGGGDYHLSSDSPAYQFSKVYILPYDIEGNSRRATGDNLGAYAYMNYVELAGTSQSNEVNTALNNIFLGLLGSSQTNIMGTGINNFILGMNGDSNITISNTILLNQIINLLCDCNITITNAADITKGGFIYELESNSILNLQNTGLINSLLDINANTQINITNAVQISEIKNLASDLILSIENTAALNQLINLNSQNNITFVDYVELNQFINLAANSYVNITITGNLNNLSSAFLTKHLYSTVNLTDRLNGTITITSRIKTTEALNLLLTGSVNL